MIDIYIYCSAARNNILSHKADELAKRSNLLYVLNYMHKVKGLKCIALTLTVSVVKNINQSYDYY